MTREDGFQNDIAHPHAEWMELCALSTTDILTAEERVRLEAHLENCAECREVYRQYSVLAHEGLPALAGSYAADGAGSPDDGQWDRAAVRERMLAAASYVPSSVATWRNALGPKRRLAPLAWAGLAAVLTLTVGVTGYYLGRQDVPAVTVALAPPSTAPAAINTANEKLALDQKLTEESQHLEELEATGVRSEQRVKDLQAKLDTLTAQVSQDATAKAAEDQTLSAALADRDGLVSKLHDAQQSYDGVQHELTQLKTQRQQDLLHYASLELEVNDLNRRLHDAEGRVKDDSQFLASDRDIRELMGARQLYIADVVDVAQNGEPRKPFGRVFYTKGKSLIFYAFDLDKQPGLKEASTFQAWAREGSDNAKPVSLGIFYMDNEANRRWVLKTEDPKALAEINAVFVTAEPKGGSQKPSGKQLLYAYLRSVSPNHP